MIAFDNDVKVTMTDKVIYTEIPDRPSSSDELQERHVESSRRILVRCKLRCIAAFHLPALLLSHPGMEERQTFTRWQKKMFTQFLGFNLKIPP